MTKFTAIELTDGQIIDVSKFTESDEGRSITFQRLGDDGPKYIIVKYRTPMTYEWKKISYPPYTVFMWVKEIWVALGVALYLHAPRQSQTFGGIMIKEV
jgi:hypothetical protein